jgi:hypothetical protein
MKRKNIKNSRKIVAYIIGVLLIGQAVKSAESDSRITLLSSVETPSYAYDLEENKFEPIDYSQSLKEVNEDIESIKVDRNKVKRVERYLATRSAPLASYSEYMVKISQKYNLDYRLIPAISIVESNGGKYAYRPYNAWGWGGAKGYSFTSWEQSISTVAVGLSKYYSSGLVTPQLIAPRYNPHTPNQWAGKVSYIMSQM